LAGANSKTTMRWEMPSGDPVLEPQDSPDHPMAPWFEKARRERREHYASRPKLRAPPTRALVTMVHNEPVFLPIWLRYYSRFFRPDDIYVMDNDTTDGSTDRDGFVRIPVEHDRVDHEWMVRQAEELQHDLLDRYDAVLVTDVDEIVAPVPERGDLGEYLDGFDEEWVNCLGYELIHMKDREAPLRLDRPILDQRRYWFFNGAYDKAALATVPMEWRPGFHGRADFHFNPDPDLRLIHLHRMDFGICLERHRVRQQRAWNDRDAEEGWAAHNRIVDEEGFERWFYGDSGFEGFAIKPELIPATWRGRF
jgi:Glycosyl transferase family 2